MRSSDRVPIRKAVIPAAGMGTRMLPLTKVVPKELLPIGRKPLIQFAVEEAVKSGIEEVILVTNSQKSAVETYFTCDSALERHLRELGRVDELASLKAVPSSTLIRMTVVLQSHPRGLGDAVLCARAAVADEPFALILPDALIEAREPAVAQLIAAYRQRPATYVGTQPIEPQECYRFGVLALSPDGECGGPSGTLRVRSIVEKPKPEEAPSIYGVFGRYLLSPEIFEFLERIYPDENDEVSFTDALALYCQKHPVCGVVLAGEHYDAGSWSGYFKAVVEFAMRDPEMGQDLRSSFASAHVRRRS